MKILKLRFNTETDGKKDFWRVIIDGAEYLADEVKLMVPVFTTRDVLPDGRTKFHISCSYNELVWNNRILTVH